MTFLASLASDCLSALAEILLFVRRLGYAAMDYIVGSVLAVSGIVLISAAGAVVGSLFAAVVVALFAFVLVVIIGLGLAASPFIAILAVVAPVAGLVGCVGMARDFRENGVGWRE